MGAFLNRPGSAALVTSALQNDPGVQGELAAAKADAASALSVDLREEEGAAARGDAKAAADWHLKALKDAGRLNVSSWNGTTTLVGPHGDVQNFINPTRGTQYRNGVEQILPGEQAVTGQIEHASAAGESAGKLENTPIKTEIAAGPFAGTAVTKLGGELFHLRYPGAPSSGSDASAVPARERARRRSSSLAATATSSASRRTDGRPWCSRTRGPPSRDASPRSRSPR